MRKTAYAKIYNSSGVLVKVFRDFVFQSFNKTINGGLGELKMEIAERFDEIAGEVQVGYELKLYVIDSEVPTGQLIYHGLIDSVESSVSDNERVTINCSGYIHQLALDLLVSGTLATISYKSQDPSVIIRDILSKYQAARTDDKITYTTSTIPLTGKSSSITFYASTPLLAIEQMKNLADADWYWKIDENNVFYFKEIATTPAHYFVMGKDISEMKIDNDIREVRNGLLFSNGLAIDDPENIFKLYSDSTSIASYGRRFDMVRDERYRKSTGSADQYGARYLNTYKDPLVVVTLEIIDSNLGNGYNIENIQPGDTYKVLNIGTNSNLTNNMVITSVTYNIDSATIEIVDVKKYVARELENIRQRQQEMEFSDNLPMNYTT